ncbi:MAG: hypothetical protein HYY93_01845 [Planctomycetes bacterium]|nr:hypothetical protein [Planctomycetota bacterium]
MAPTPGAASIVRNAGSEAAPRIRQLMRSALAPNRMVTQMRANQSRLDQKVDSALDGTRSAIQSAGSRRSGGISSASKALASAGIGRRVDRTA